VPSIASIDSGSSRLLIDRRVSVRGDDGAPLETSSWWGEIRFNGSKVGEIRLNERRPFYSITAIDQSMTDQAPDGGKDAVERPMATGRSSEQWRPSTTMAESLRAVERGDEVRLDVETDRELAFVTGVQWVEEDDDPYNPDISKTITVAIEDDVTPVGRRTDEVELSVEGGGERVIYTTKEVAGSWTPPILLSWDGEAEAYQEFGEVMAVSVV
jgi:hypothetical protein